MYERSIERWGTCPGDDEWIQSCSLTELSSIRRTESDFLRTLGGCESSFEGHTKVGYLSALPL